MLIIISQTLRTALTMPKMVFESAEMVKNFGPFSVSQSIYVGMEAGLAPNTSNSLVCAKVAGKCCANIPRICCHSLCLECWQPLGEMCKQSAQIWCRFYAKKHIGEKRLDFVQKVQDFIVNISGKTILYFYFFSNLIVSCLNVLMFSGIWLCGNSQSL